MRRRVAVIAAIAAVALLLLLRVSSSEPVALWHDVANDGDGQAQQSDDSNGESAANGQPPPAQLGNTQLKDRHESSQLSDHVAIIALVAALTALVVWLSRQRWSVPPTERRERIEAIPDVPGDLAHTAERLDAVLDEGSPRNAIVECWVQLEAAVESAGLARDPTETAREFTARVLGSHVVDQQAINTLAELYREARFSNHELGEHHRDQARTALAELSRQLHGPVVSTSPQP